MEIGGARARAKARAAALLVVFAAVAAVAAGRTAAAGVDEAGRPCFHACFDQCVPRDDFWFCQFSCYHRCAGSGRAVVRGGGGLGCERSCVLSLCGRLQPGSKVMAVCRDTCRKSYATAACAS